MATSKLLIYNGALQVCSERKLASTSEENEARRQLDLIWDDGGVNYCLEQGQWKFAMRATRLDFDTGVTPDWGYKRAFQKPNDWLITSSLASDEFFTTPLIQVNDEAGYWYASIDQIFVRYVSSDDAVGNNLSLWPATFTQYVKSYFAYRVIRKLSGGDEDRIKEVKARLDLDRRVARNRDAMADPTKFPPPGSWNQSRSNRGGGPLGDGGSAGSLIG